MRMLLPSQHLRSCHHSSLLLSCALLVFASSVNCQDEQKPSSSDAKDSSEGKSVVQEWFAQMNDRKYDCGQYDKADLLDAKELFELVDCSEPGAIFGYSIKVRTKHRISIF